MLHKLEAYEIAEPIMASAGFKRANWGLDGNRLVVLVPDRAGMRSVSFAIKAQSRDALASTLRSASQRAKEIQDVSERQFREPRNDQIDIEEALAKASA